MARESSLSPEKYEEMVGRIREMGYDVSKLMKVHQDQGVRT